MASNSEGTSGQAIFTPFSQAEKAVLLARIATARAELSARTRRASGYTPRAPDNTPTSNTFQLDGDYGTSTCPVDIISDSEAGRGLQIACFTQPFELKLALSYVLESSVSASDITRAVDYYKHNSRFDYDPRVVATLWEAHYARLKSTYAYRRTTVTDVLSESEVTPEEAVAAVSSFRRRRSPIVMYDENFPWKFDTSHEIWVDPNPQAPRSPTVISPAPKNPRHAMRAAVRKMCRALRSRFSCFRPVQEQAVAGADEVGFGGFVTTQSGKLARTGPTPEVLPPPMMRKTRAQRDEAQRFAAAVAAASTKKPKEERQYKRDCERLAETMRRQDLNKSDAYEYEHDVKMSKTVFDKLTGLLNREGVLSDALKAELRGMGIKNQGVGQGIALGSAVAASACVAVAARRATKALSSIITTLGNADRRLNSTAEVAERSIEAVATSTVGLADVLRDSVDSLKNMFRRVYGTKLWVVPILVFIYYHYCDINNRPTALLMASLLVPVIGPTLWDHLSEFFRDGSVVTQAGTSNMGKFLAATMAFSVFGGAGRDKVGEFTKRIANVERCSTGLEAVMEWALDTMQVVINWMCDRFSMEHVTLRKEKNAEVRAWVRAVDKEDLLSTTVAEPISPAIASRYVHLAQQGHGFLELYRGTPQVSQVISTKLAVVRRLLTPMVGSLSAQQNFRQEPVFLLLEGPPGIGKTILMQYISCAILKQSKLLGDFPTNAQVKANIWQRGSGDFWNGYNGQECIVVDDAFQGRTSTADKENEYIHLIHTVGSWSCPLNMADVESKGKIYFSSKLILGTTNTTSILSEAEKVVATPGAVVRRIKYPYALRLLEQFRGDDGCLNMLAFSEEVRKCEGKAGMDGFPWYMWNVYKHDFHSGQTDYSSALPLRTLIETVSADLRARSLMQPTATAALDRFLDNMSEITPVTEPAVQTQGFFGFFLKARTGTAILETTGFIDAYYEAIEKSEMRNAHAVIAYVLPIVGAVVLGGLVWKAARAIFDKIMSYFRPQTAQQSNRPLSHATKVNKKHVSIQSAGADIADQIFCNSFKMVLKLSDTQLLPIGQVLFVNDKLALQPYHFTFECKRMIGEGRATPDTPVIFYNARNPEFQFTVSLGRYLDFARHTNVDRDVEFLKLDPGRASRNITNKFIFERDLRHVGGNSSRLDVCSLKPDGSVVPYKDRLVHSSPSFSVGGAYWNGISFIERHLKYKACTEAGDCGAVLCITNNPSYQARVACGIHVAADSNGYAYASIVTQEMINEARTKLGTLDDLSLSDMGRITQSGVAFIPSVDLPFKSLGSFLPIGELDKGPTVCPHTSLYKTRHYGAFGEHDYSPAAMSAVMREGVKVYPLEKALLGYASPLLYYEHPWMQQIAHVAFGPLAALTRDSPRPLYTFDEAVLGIPETKFRSIPRSTAAGFPYTYTFKNGKTAFFGDGDIYDLEGKNCDDLRDRVALIEECAKNNERMSHIFMDFPKDELRPAKKVEDVATRLISAAPLDYTILWRMYFGAFSSATMLNHTRTGMAPGICTYTDWDQVVNMLHRHGNKVFAGDFKQFDASEQPSVHDVFLEYINKWYDDGPVNARVRTVLWAELTHSRHVGGLGNDQRYVYQWAKSLPSGHPFTTIVNSMYSLFLLVSAYYITTGDLTDFWANVGTVVYGDDNVSGVSDKVVDKFNQVTVAHCLHRDFGVTFTSDVKDGELVRYTVISGTTFLKRSFFRDGMRWLCPLGLDSFLYTVYWCKNKKLEQKIAVDVLENSLEELSMHDQGTWDEFAPKIYALLQELGIVPKAPLDRGSYLRIVTSRKDSWF